MPFCTVPSGPWSGCSEAAAASATYCLVVRFEELDDENEGEVRALILAGLSDHWGSIDEMLNPDLDDMTVSYRHGRTVLVRDDDGILVGTGTIVPRSSTVAEILRMSVAAGRRGDGIGRQIVDELVATAERWGVEVVVLETSTSWSEVVSFYLRCGFSISRVEEGEFGSDTWFEKSTSGPDQTVRSAGT